LIIRDFDRQSVVSPADVGALVRELPKSHLQGLQTILYKPMAEFLRLQISIGASCKGAFYPEYRAIIIFDLVDKSSAAHILYHEIGHYVFHRVIGTYLKKAWVHQIFGKCPASSEYGRRNAIEDFAETYALYAQNPATLAHLPAKSQFMRKNVFK
jgi:hypothetical protein